MHAKMHNDFSVLQELTLEDIKLISEQALCVRIVVVPPIKKYPRVRKLI